MPPLRRVVFVARFDQPFTIGYFGAIIIFIYIGLYLDKGLNEIYKEENILIEDLINGIVASTVFHLVGLDVSTVLFSQADMNTEDMS